MKIKILSILCILILLLTVLSGCYDARGIEDLAYITAIGLDISDNDLLLLTLQISIPSSNSSSGSSQSNSTDTITVECSSINSGLSLINSYISKEIDLSHCKVIIISEKLAEQGIYDYIDTLANNIELRPDCNVIVSRCDAQTFIDNASPSIETLTARYYEVALNSSNYTGFTPSTKLIDFISNIKNTSIQASCILGGINTNKKADNNTSATTNLSNNYKAGNTPIDNSSSVETFGTAVFNSDKLVGELTGLETIFHLLLINELQNCTISVPNIYKENSNVDLRIKRKKKSKIKVELINGTPYVSIKVFLEGYGLSLDSKTNYNSISDLEEINTSAEEYIKQQLQNYLYKTSKDLQADIDGFGKHIITKYLTIDDWLASSWLSNYKNSFFNIDVNVNIKSGYEFNKSP